jgi:hypothetical protein
MKTLQLLLVVLIFSSCAYNHTSENDYISHYRIWRSSVTSELAAGHSWVYGDQHELDYLGAHAEEHLVFLQRELSEDVLCVLVLESSPLRKELGERPAVLELQNRQKQWLILLNRKIQKNPTPPNTALEPAAVGGFRLATSRRFAPSLFDGSSAFVR